MERTTAPLCLRLVADDLTGALDTAAQFAAPAAPIDVFWRRTVPTGSVAVDAGTRELAADAAGRLVAAQVACFPADPAACHFAKLDSLLRGHAAAEIHAWHQAMAFDHCIVAPAFPHQNRITRAGRQHYREAGGWLPTPCDLHADLRRHGFTVFLRRPGDPACPGFSLWDAETDADLQAVAAAGRSLSGSVLWCGSGGLAGALGGGGHAAGAPLRRPLLGLFGTDHPATEAQLAASGAAVLDLPDGGAASAARLTRQLRQDGVALARLAVPAGTPRGAAARLIEQAFGALLHRLAPPATLLVSGGETLRSICVALAADHLELAGQLAPGVPCSVIRGGRLAGVHVVSKSGAFGDRDALARIVAHGAAPQRGTLA
jgi:uncharacterized protein YgbK (DUF1537 family)